MPMIELSASGVSSTRAWPNSAASPSVARNTPPRGPTSSPRITTRSSAARSRCCVQRTVSTMLRSVPPSGSGIATGGGGRIARAVGRAGRGAQRVGEHLAVGGARLGRRRRLGRLGGGVDLVLHLGLDALLVGLRQEPLLDEVLRDPAQRVLLAPRLHLLRRAVGAVVVVGGVGEVAVGLALDERRAVAAAGVADRGVHRGVHVERVVAVDDHAAEAVGVGAVGDVVDRRLRRSSARRWRSRCSRRRTPSGAGGCRRS